MKSSSWSEALSGAPEHEHRREGGGQTECEAQSGHLLERKLEREEAPENRPERPQSGSQERIEHGRLTVERHVERARERHQPGPGEAPEQEQAEAGPRPLPEHDRSERDRDQRLYLLQDDRRDRISVDECLREQDRGQRRRARADDDSRNHEARSGAPDGRQRGHDDG